jgi:hypothetical protein
MSNRQNLKMSVLAVAAFVLGSSAVLFAPAKATSESDAVAIAAAGEVGYLPGQVAVQATEIEVQPATF